MKEKEGGEGTKEKFSIPVAKEGEVYEFGYLIGVILDYYESSSNSTEEGDGWKKGTDYEPKVVPDEIDNLIKKAFTKQLTKFSK